MKSKKLDFEFSELSILNSEQQYLYNNFMIRRNIIDSLSILNKHELGPLTIIATYLNNTFKRRVYTGTFEIPIYGKNSFIIFYETDSKEFILVIIEKHFIGDIIGLNGTVFFESNNDRFCLNKFELIKNSEVILTECPWGINILLEKEITHFKFVSDNITNFKVLKPPNDWNPITSTIFPFNRINIELARLIKLNKSYEVSYLNIYNDTLSALLFIIDHKYMGIFLPENYSYSYNKDLFTIFRSDGSYYNIFKGLFKSKDGLKIVTNAPWNNHLIFDDNLSNILKKINKRLDLFVLPKINIGRYDIDLKKKLPERLSKRMKILYKPTKNCK